MSVADKAAKTSPSPARAPRVPVKDRAAGFIVDHRVAVMLAMAVLTLACAALIPRVEVNTDMSRYLADDSPMKIGTDLLAEQLPGIENPKTIRLMLTGLSGGQKEEALSMLREIDGVDGVSYEAGSESYNRGDHTLYVLSTPFDYDSPEEVAIEADALAVAEALSAQPGGGSQVGAVLKNDNPATSTLPPVIVVIALVLLALVLFVMGPSWIEPLLYLVAIGCAVGINLGTNIVQGSIAQVTFSIGAILQLVLSMDYSIILMNRFRQELAGEASARGLVDPSETGPASSRSLARVMSDDSPEGARVRASAMKRALAKAFTAISASSLTTFAGLLSLVFMTFKIGGDLGVVLAKGVLVSLLCVFTVLPGLILAAHRLIARSSKPSPTLRLNGLAAVEHRARHGLLVGFAALFVAAYLLQGGTAVSYTLNYVDPVADVFPVTSRVVVLYDNADEEGAASIADRLAADGRVRAVDAWSTTLGKPLTADDMLDAFEQMGGGGDGAQLSRAFVDLLFYIDRNGADVADRTMTLSEFVDFVADDLIADPSLASLVDPDQADLLGAYRSLVRLADTGEPLTPSELADTLEGFAGTGLGGPSSMLGGASSSPIGRLVGFAAGDAGREGASVAAEDGSFNDGSSAFSLEQIELVYLLHAARADVDPEQTMTVSDLVELLEGRVLADGRFADMIDADQRSSIEGLARTVADARAQMVGPDYSIFALTSETASGSADTASLMDDLASMCDASLAGDHYLIGDAAMVREMRQGFGREMLTITLVSAIAIFLVVAIAFRSLVIPAILVLVVQCGVYLTVLAIGLQGYHIYYLAMLIVQCILMGATIDYGILYTNMYREGRQTMDAADALAHAYNASINTIMTSGLIMILVTAAIALTSPEPTIGQICQTISMGATSAVVLILLFLPGILASLDRFTAK